MRAERAAGTGARVRRLSRSQHPHHVAAHAAALAGRLASDPGFRLVVLEAITPHLPPAGPDRDALGAAWPAALHRWARSVRHVREPGALGELLLRPARVVQYGAGDCDDVALAVAAMAAHVGLPAGILSLWTGDATAHHVAVVGAGWYGATSRLAPRLVVDPDQRELCLVTAEHYRFGRLYPVKLAA